MFYERWDFAINKAFGSSLPVWSIIEAHQKEKQILFNFCTYSSTLSMHIYLQSFRSGSSSAILYRADGCGKRCPETVL